MGDTKGTPASSNAKVAPHTDAMEDDPFDPVTLLVRQLQYYVRAKMKVSPKPPKQDKTALFT